MTEKPAKKIAQELFDAKERKYYLGLIIGLVIGTMTLVYFLDITFHNQAIHTGTFWGAGFLVLIIGVLYTHRRRQFVQRFLKDHDTKPKHSETQK